MGTRSLTIARQGLEEKSPRLFTMYRQMDGYPSGHGVELAEFLSQINLVNGIRCGDDRKTANGSDCLAAQIVWHFKKGEVGGFYLISWDEGDEPGSSGEEYIYEVFADTFSPEKGIIMSCYDVYEQKVLFKGTPQEFLEYVKNKVEEE